MTELEQQLEKEEKAQREYRKKLEASLSVYACYSHHLSVKEKKRADFLQDEAYVFSFKRKRKKFLSYSEIFEFKSLVHRVGEIFIEHYESRIKKGGTPDHPSWIDQWHLKTIRFMRRIDEALFRAWERAWRFE